MTRRDFVGRVSFGALGLASTCSVLTPWCRSRAATGFGGAAPLVDPDTARVWLALWQDHILGEARVRYCDTETGEELGWLVSPFLNGFYYGYKATGDAQWMALLVDWTDAVLKRARKEPDGFPGWPKGDGGGHESSDYSADSLLGEAMMFQPVVLAAAEITKTPALEAKWESRARSYQEMAGQIFQKWDSRGCWRLIQQGGLWVVPPFGLDRQTPSQWSSGYQDRLTGGFSNPDNKQNLIAEWLVAMYDVTGTKAYRDRAEAWWRVMRSRMTTRDNGQYYVWNYWEPGGTWDYDAKGAPRHWIGVHPNGGYYQLDAQGIVAGFEHGLAFARSDIDRLIATNRDFMWNQKLEAPKFQRIDGGPADPRWQEQPGLLWTALTPYDATLRKLFLATHKPDSWAGLSATPWALSTHCA